MITYRGIANIWTKEDPTKDLVVPYVADLALPNFQEMRTAFGLKARIPFVALKIARRYSDIEIKEMTRYMLKQGRQIPESVRILRAHGSVEEGSWMYWDIDRGKKIGIPIDNWIDEHDGNYGALFITCCNKGAIVQPRISLIVYPKGDFDLVEVLKESVETGGKGYSDLFEIVTAV